MLWYTPPNITYVIAFWNVDNVHVDPCNAAAGELEPPIGPSVDDLVAALSNLPGLEATAPVDVTVGTFRGKEIELTTLDPEDCPAVTVFSAGDADLEHVNPSRGREVSRADPGCRRPPDRALLDTNPRSVTPPQRPSSSRSWTRSESNPFPDDEAVRGPRRPSHQVCVVRRGSTGSWRSTPAPAPGRFGSCSRRPCSSD